LSSASRHAEQESATADAARTARNGSVRKEAEQDDFQLKSCL